MTDPYFLPRGYESRLEPEHFVEDDPHAVWQPDLYQKAAIVARRLGLRRIIGIGCETVLRLAHLHPEFELVGIDRATNLSDRRAGYESVTWIDTDLESSADLGYADTSGAVIVCAELIEHIVHPERLLRMLRRALDSGTADAVFLSTAERVLTDKGGKLGPPRDRAHVREWTLPEFEQFLSSEELHGFLATTRSNDAVLCAPTIIAAVAGNSSASQEIVRDWFDEESRWKRLAERRGKRIDELERWASEVTSARDWAEEQRAAWQVRAETVAAQLAEDVPRETLPDLLPESVQASSARTSARIRVITEVEHDPIGLDVTKASLLAQTFGDWEWAIVTTDASMMIPDEDSRIRVVRNASRARALADAIAGSGDIAVIEQGKTIPPTALEKWLWFLEAYPDCTSVYSSPSENGSRTPRMIRRSTVDGAGSLDTAAEVTLASSGFVPLPDSRPEKEWGHRAPSYIQGANEWLPTERSIWNPVESSGRRLLLIVPFMTTGGADKVTLDVLDQLGALGWQTTVATTLDGAHELYLDYEKRTIDLFPLAHFLPLPYQPLFLRYLIESRRPDAILLSNSELAYRLLPYLRAMCPDTPIVDFCHSEAEHWNEGGYPRFSVEYRQFLDLTLTASEHLRRWMVERGGDGSRIEICYANVDIHAFRPMPEARDMIRHRFALPSNEPIVLFVGRISEDKQPRVLAATLARLRERNVRFTAVIAGDGPDQRWLKAALRKNRSGDGVRMLGSVSSQEIAPLMAAADVFFLPSRSEGIALALYEAMASGTAVVGARVGGQAELVTEQCGFLIERSTPAEEAARYADAIEQLLHDPDRRAAMGAAGRARVESSFSLERLGTRVDELLQHAIDLHRTCPQPAPTPASARTSATETVELMRLAWLMDVSWHRQVQQGGIRGVGVSLYVLLRTFMRPAYHWGIRHGWSWLPRLRDVLSRNLFGLPG